MRHVPDCPWIPGTPFIGEAELSDEEEEFYFMDEEKKKEAKEQKKVKKLKELREKCALRSVSVLMKSITEEEVSC